jgi:glycosyltransferase involved in cell wall biosynthesis
MTESATPAQPRIAVVIPCYRVTAHILAVLANIGPEVARIYVVDDACPDGSGDLVARNCNDPRVVVLRNELNRGVGGAVMHGYRQAAADGCDCIVKIDGDGQMDPALLPLFVAPILRGEADYTKGNRFFNPEDVAAMPPLRLFGNGVLSFLSKASTGYWRLFDPTNGYTAISAPVAERLPLDKISERYFFESDLLFRLGTLGAVIQDIPMKAVYGSERSNLRIGRILPGFLAGHVRNTFKRIFYTYYLRDFSIASIELVLGIALLLFGLVFGSLHWEESQLSGQPATSGTVMLAALPVILGIQLLLSFLHFDLAREPRQPLSSRLRPQRTDRWR